MDFNQRFVVLDIETTGLSYEYWDEPTEIAAIEIIDKKITGNKMHFYLKPYKKINVDFLNKVFGKNLVKKYNEKDFKNLVGKNKKNLEKDNSNVDYLNIKKEIESVISESENMLKNINSGGNKKNMLPELRNFIGDSIVIGHNISFDINFLNFWNNEYGIDLYNNYICTMKNFKDFHKTKENNLTACCKYYNINLENAHNALDDTIATANLFLKELNDFEPKITYFEKHQSYSNFKKRIFKANYAVFMKNVLLDSCDISKNIENLTEIEIESIENLFINSKKPLEVSKITGLDLGSVEYIFLNWINCININKHLDLIKDKYLSETIKEILKYTDRDYSKIEEINKYFFKQNSNYFFFKLFERLEYEKDDMNYELNDFDFYFKNLKNLDELSQKIDRDKEYIYNYLIKWINTDNKNFLLYKGFLKSNYKENPKTETEIALKKAIYNNKNKDYILRQLSIL